MSKVISNYVDRNLRDYYGNARIPRPVVATTNYTTAPVNPEVNLNHINSTYNQLAIKPNEKVLYLELYNNMDQEGKNLLNQLLPTGKLHSRDSNDGSSTLENLHKILKQPRVPFLSSKNILKETLRTLVDPYIITQNFGDIPDKYEPDILKKENVRLQLKTRTAKANGTYDPEFETDTYPITERDINFSKGHTCPAASIEFNLADRKPAEFVRYVEGLTSPEKSAKTKIRYADLSPSLMEAVTALVQQNTDFRSIDWQNVEITIRPDENAYLRADAQEDNRVKNSRSLVDVLMQSAFMQLGSRETYNTLTDNRSKETGGGKGLNQFEIAFVESIVDSKSRKVPVVYMELDDEATKILNYTYDQKSIKKHLVDSLDKGNNIIVGFLVNIDNQGNVITPDGHEILLTGYRYDANGKLLFKYNDTDDGDYFAPSWMEAEGFIPTIHHANIPESVLKEKFESPDVGYMYLQDYNRTKADGF